MIDTIFVDMDGVIADFDKRYFELFGEAKSKEKFNERFQQFIESRQFETLDLLPGAIKLINFLSAYNIPKRILSSTARPIYYRKISDQKQVWLKNNFIRWPQIFVPGASIKRHWATPNSILIDDHLLNIEDWNKNGGIGIHHKDVDITIETLKKYI